MSRFSKVVRKNIKGTAKTVGVVVGTVAGAAVGQPALGAAAGAELGKSIGKAAEKELDGKPHTPAPAPREPVRAERDTSTGALNQVDDALRVSRPAAPAPASQPVHGGGFWAALNDALESVYRAIYG